MEERETKSKFNAALAKLERISDIKKGITNARLTKDYNHWKELLSSWRSEINERFNDKQIASADTHEHLISSSFSPMKSNEVVLPHPFAKFKPNPPDIKLIYFLLNKYELYLGSLEGKFGISLVDDEDEEGL